MSKNVSGLLKGGKIFVCSDVCRTLLDAVQIARVEWSDILFVTLLNGNTIRLAYKKREDQEKDYALLWKVRNRIIDMYNEL